MELPSCVSTKPAQIQDNPSLSVFGAHNSPDRPQQHYPSPSKVKTPGSVPKLAINTMTATSPVDGFAAMSAYSHSGSVSPRTVAVPKSVSFELLFPESPQCRARLPLRVSIYPHDTTDSIVTTVKNFYGLYSGPAVSKGVSFEDDQGNTLIARYENFHNNMVVTVRVFDEPSSAPEPFRPHGFHSASVGVQSYYNLDVYQPQPPQQYAQQVSRPASRTSRVRSPSPNSARGRRSDSAGTHTTTSKKGRSRSSKTRTPGAAVGEARSESVNGYSSGDGASASISSKTKEQLGNTEISVENIVEGGRRKRAKFESSELPLFAPPQMPAATSNPSVSPARRIDHHAHSLPFVHPGQNPFRDPRPLQSPQSYHNGYGPPSMFATPAVEDRRARGSFGYSQGGGIGPGMGMMPTPEPTVGSCMSEEDKDVAIQLMRLGEMSNISHGRTSASTLDDTFSGRADAASSTGATSDAESGSEDEIPPSRRQKLDSAGGHKKLFSTTEAHFVGPKESVEASGDDADYEDGVEQGLMAAPRLKNPKPKSSNTPNGARPRSQSSNKVRTTSSKSSKPKVKKATTTTGPLGPMTPASLPASRKQSVVSNPPPVSAAPLLPGEDDHPDLSTKPRCQRCRKSKKGCDRQRPCARCRDAGLTAKDCISEDEGNGRKGRYGRHMGVPLVTKENEPALTTALLPAAPIAAAIGAAAVGAAADPSSVLASAAPLPVAAATPLDKNKKRKR
ncbi:C6 finger domain-containing protein [Apodospora peruviana]|uniref:C6 finger domain-containing protein n=1 Tax=Apodospora peruviana TaxID=516989 RepID=A0AAE0MAU0_9PEZI|nr:C6 finger domain-containing protein [Apodospora peruviana]